MEDGFYYYSAEKFHCLFYHVLLDLLAICLHRCVLRHGLRLKQCNKEAVKHAGTYFHFLNVLMAFMLLTVKSKYGFSIFTLSIIKVFSAFSSGIFIYIL